MIDMTEEQSDKHYSLNERASNVIESLLCILPKALLGDAERLLAASVIVELRTTPSHERENCGESCTTPKGCALFGCKLAVPSTTPQKPGVWEWPINTVGRLIGNLQNMPPEMPFYTAYFVEIDGKKISRTTHPSVSRETVANGRVQQYDAGNESLVMWATCAASATACSTDAKDAARYRWLRDLSVPPHNFYIAVPDEFKDERYAPQQVDAAIDAAMRRPDGGKQT